jgi:hypothetical protein
MSAAPSTPFDAANCSRARLERGTRSIGRPQGRPLSTGYGPRLRQGPRSEASVTRFARSPRWVTSVAAVPPRPAAAFRAAKASKRSARRASYFADTVSTSRSVHALSNSRFGRTVESEHQFEAAVGVGRDPVRFSGFRLPQWVNDGVGKGKNEKKRAIIHTYWLQCRP